MVWNNLASESLTCETLSRLGPIHPFCRGKRKADGDRRLGVGGAAGFLRFTDGARVVCSYAGLSVVVPRDGSSS